MQIIQCVDNVSQFVQGESISQCGAYGVSILHYGGQQAATGNANDIHALAKNLYTRFVGADIPSDYNGVNQTILGEMIVASGNHWHATATDGDTIRAWLRRGYPVIIETNEQSVFDFGVNGKPYPWNAIYQHVISLVGYDTNGNFLVHDPANPHPSPRVYDAGKLTKISATVFVPAWKSQPGTPNPNDIPIATTSTTPAKEQTVQPYTPSSSTFATYFTTSDTDHWVCKQTEKVLQYGIKGFWCSLSIDGNSLPVLGLPTSNEMYITYKGVQIVLQAYERGYIILDPTHVFDSQSGFGDYYLAHVDDPLILATFGVQQQAPAPVPTLTPAEQAAVAFARAILSSK